jgi:hypothetical protein
MSRYRDRFGSYVTDRYTTLLTATEFYRYSVTSVTDRNIVCFEHIFKVLLKKLM